MDPLKKDKRFAHVAQDPRFHKMARKYRKVKIDKRFKGMMKDEQFKLKYTVDPRGRPINATSDENLRRFYDLSSDEDSGDDSEDEEEQLDEKETSKDSHSKKISEKAAIRNDEKDSSAKSLHSAASDDDGEQTSEEEGDGSEEKSEEDEEESSDDSIDYARGQGNVESSTEEDWSDDEAVGEEFDHGWNDVDKEVVEDVESTCRLAICNMNWDRIKAVDLFVLVSSFLPTGGVLHSIAVYPSEFGKERMAEEEALGPRELREKRDTAESDQKEDSRYQREKLRQYQLSRLKYYYAVAEFDSISTADHVYKNCDGIEYESSASRLDLRFIPEGMTFDDKPTSRATEFPDATVYKPSKFLTDALQQAKVHLTWDETDHDRIAFTQRNFSKDDIEDMDVKAYLASSSGGEEEEEQDPYAGIEGPDFEKRKEKDAAESDEDQQIDKYRSLLKGLKEADEEREDDEKDMEITWEPGLKEATEEKISSVDKEEEEETPWDSYLKDRKDKKKNKKKEKIEAAKSRTGGQETEAFSDDELPDDAKESFFQDSLASTSKKKKKTKKKKAAEMTEEEKKQAQELSLLLMDENEEEKESKHFSLSAIQEAEELKNKKRKRKKMIARGENVPEVDNFKVDVEDSRFKDLFDNPLFNIDPSAPEFKKTSAMDALVEEKVKRRAKNKYKPPAKKVKAESEPKLEPSTSLNLTNLVKSVKQKTKSMQQKKKSLLPH